MLTTRRDLDPDYVDRRAQGKRSKTSRLHRSELRRRKGTPERFTASAPRPACSTLRSQLMLGRAVTDEDAVEGKDKVVVLSYGAWQKFFNGDRGIVGKEVRFNSMPYTWWRDARSFPLPVRATQVGAVRVRASPSDRRGRGNEYSETSGVSRRHQRSSTRRWTRSCSATPSLPFMAASARKVSQFLKAGNFTGCLSLRDHASRPETDPVPAPGCDAVRALDRCANVANLMLTRVSGARASLGAHRHGRGRWRIARQPLTESVPLSAAAR
jgi:hypothetical protein